MSTNQMIWLYFILVTLAFATGILLHSISVVF